jgi:hypothetical protein
VDSNEVVETAHNGCLELGRSIPSVCELCLAILRLAAKEMLMIPSQQSLQCAPFETFSEP